MLQEIRCAGLGLAALITFAASSSAQAAIDLVGASDVTFQWTSPTGPEPIDSYFVFVSLDGTTFPSSAQIITSTASATIPGSPGQSITIRVQALDRLGSLSPVSASSDTVNFLAAAPAPAPAPDPAPAPAPTTEMAPVAPESGVIARPIPQEPEPAPDPVDPPVDPGTRVPFDFDADGRAEILLRAQATGEVAVLATDGEAITDASLAASISHPDWNVVAAGDFDANGTSDLVLLDDSTGEIAVALALALGDFRTSVLGSEGGAWQFATAGDLDGDGRADLIWRSSTNGALIVWYMDGDEIVATSSLPGMQLDWTLLGCGDIDGDGTDDILWRQARGPIKGWRMQAGSVAENTSLGYHSPSRLEFMGFGDMNGDGREQPIWQVIADRRVWIWKMSGFSKSGEALIHLDHDAERIVMIADYDGDQISDLLTSHQNELAIHLLEQTRIRSTSVIGETSAGQTAVGVR